MIDGMETTDTWLGTPGQYLATDFVEEVQVKSSGYSAEYGGSTGGVLNVVTKSGSNDWRGQALLLFSGDALDAGLRPTLRLVPSDITRAEYVTYPEDDYTQVEPGFTLGGPVVRNRAWFFAGYVPSLRRYRPHADVSGRVNAVHVLAARRPGIRRRERERAVRAALANEGGVQLGPRRAARAAPGAGRDGQPGRKLLGRQDRPELLGVGERRLHAQRPRVSQRARGVFFPRRLQRGRLQGDQFVYRTSSQNLPGVPPEFQHPRRLHERAVERPPRSCARAAFQRSRWTGRSHSPRQAGTR